MANDTKVAIPGRITVDEVINALESLGVFVIKTEVEVKENTSRPKTTKVGDVACPIVYRDNANFKEYGYIDIFVNGVDRSIFYHYNSQFVLDPEEFERNLDRGLVEFNQSMTTLSLGMNPDAVSLLTQLARYFDGYIDEDDCDDYYYHKVL